jgi:hypothetical protein
LNILVARTVVGHEEYLMVVERLQDLERLGQVSTLCADQGDF